MTVIDTVRTPDLSSDYPLTPEQIDAYRRDGHIKLEHLASREEIEAYRPHLAETLRRYCIENRPFEERDTYGKAFLKTENLFEKDEACRKFVLARRFAKAAADLMGVDRVRLYHDQAIFKEAGGGHTPWHQDNFYWPLGTEHTVTMWMPLVDVSPEMGSMTFATHSHKDGLVASLAISDKSDEVLQEHIRERGYPLTNAGFVGAGDATFHSGWALHSAPGNASDQTREVMTIIYYADGTPVVDPDQTGFGWDRHSFLPGCKPGDLAVSDRNPLVFDRNAR
jgi:ectoine hydroxylase-related dioxygenase (phytanoyl-CoA dioxygenase family)